MRTKSGLAIVAISFIRAGNIMILYDIARPILFTRLACSCFVWSLESLQSNMMRYYHFKKGFIWQALILTENQEICISYRQEDEFEGTKSWLFIFVHFIISYSGNTLGDTFPGSTLFKIRQKKENNIYREKMFYCVLFNGKKPEYFNKEESFFLLSAWIISGFLCELNSPNCYKLQNENTLLGA